MTTSQVNREYNLQHFPSSNEYVVTGPKDRGIKFYYGMGRKILDVLVKAGVGIMWLLPLFTVAITQSLWHSLWLIVTFAATAMAAAAWIDNQVLPWGRVFLNQSSAQNAALKFAEEMKDTDEVLRQLNNGE